MKKVFLLFVMLLASSAGYAQGYAAADAVAWADANGKKIGNALIQTDLSEIVLRTDDGQIFAASIDPEHGFWGGPGIVFSGTNCTGSAYTNWASIDGPLPTALFGPPGAFLYKAVPGVSYVAPDTPVTIQSGWSPWTPGRQDQGNWGCTSFSPTQHYGVPLVPAADLGAQFQTPFHLIGVVYSPTGTAQCCGDCNGNGQVTVDEILTAVNSALNGCAH